MRLPTEPSSRRIHTVMMRFAYLGAGTVCLLASCSGTVSNDHPESGGTLAVSGGASSVAGGASAIASSATTITGGVTSTGGSLGLGGTLPANGGSTAPATYTGGSSGVNCAMVGCAAPPLCSTGCTDVCGCCPCSEGSQRGSQICKNGCWAELGTGGAILLPVGDPDSMPVATSSLHRAMQSGACRLCTLPL
jgi:hypothetical protein